MLRSKETKGILDTVSERLKTANELRDRMDETTDKMDNIKGQLKELRDEANGFQEQVERYVYGDGKPGRGVTHPGITGHW